MLHHPTQISGITAVLPVQYSDSGAASLRFPSRPRVFAAQAKGIFKSLRGLFLRRAPRPFAVHPDPSLCTPPLRLPSGSHGLRSSLFAKPFGRALFAFAGRFATPLLAAERLQHQAKVASPTVAPRGHERSSERLRPRQIST